MALPVSYSWSLVPDSSPSSTVGPPTFPPGASPGTCAADFITQDELLELFDRILPTGYLEPLKRPGPGYELLQAWTKELERASLAVGHVECNLFIGSANGGIQSEGLVEFTRDSGAAGSVTVKAGTIVTTSVGGRDFVALEDAVFAGAALGPISARVRAVAAGWEWNVLGQVITPAGEVLVGEIDTIKLPLQDPGYGDPTIKVRQVLSFTNGQAAMLDQHGLDRNIPRRPGEFDEIYRARIRSLPDTVSPDAVQRALILLLDQYGATFDFIETWEVTYQTCYDAPTTVITGSDFDPNLFCYDDPRSPVPFRGRYLDEDDYRGAFIVVVPNFTAVLDVGMAYDDDTSDSLSSHTTALGRRAHNAYDVPNNANTQILQGGYDGFDLGKSSVYKGILDLLREIKAGGVLSAVELEGE